MHAYDIYDLTEEQIDKLSKDDLNYIANFFDWDFFYKDNFSKEEDYLNFIKKQIKEQRCDYLKVKPLIEKSIDRIFNSKDIQERIARCKVDKEYNEKCFQEYKEGWVEIGEVCKELFNK